MGDMVIALIFPEPENSIELAEIVDRAQKIGKDIPNVKIQMTRGDAAETIKFFVTNGELPIDEDEDQSQLLRHARNELERIENDPEFNASIIAAIKGFRSYGHSGGSASIAIPMLNDLLNFKNLTPLTNDPKEWNNISDISGEQLWQSRRCADAFSHNGGKTYYLLSEGGNNKNPNPQYETEKVV